MLRLPDDGVSVEVSGGVKPEIELLLPIAFALSVDIGVKNIRVTAYISQELKINFIVGWSLG